MSNVIKNGDYTYTTNPIQTEQQPLHLTIRVPLIDTGCTAEQQRRKMLEELDELLNEFSAGPVNLTQAFEETHDVVQVLTGFVLAKIREESPGIHPVDLTKGTFDIASKRHERKILQRAQERGWVVIGR